jgi:DNA-binding NarL/FixJ family response regulator
MDCYHGTILRGYPLRRRLQLLTPRQTDVLRLVAAGKLSKQIAGDLNISIKTVQRHRQTLMNKLNIHNTAGLTRYAVSKGIADGRNFESAGALAVT